MAHILFDPLYISHERVIGYSDINGDNKISGFVDRLGEVGRYRITLHDAKTSIPFKETWSDENGYYEFNHITNKPTFVVAHDHTPSPDRVNSFVYEPCEVVPL